LATREYCDYCKKDITKQRTTFIEIRYKDEWVTEISCDKCSKLIKEALQKIKEGV